jgi:hypothetical protein
VGQTSDASGIYSFIQQSAYPGVHFWMTEFGVWCSSCQSGTAGDGSWINAQATASALINHLANGASAGLTFEAWDSVYSGYNAATGQNAPGHWSLWGLFAVDDKNAVTNTYTPRKQFYTLSQITKYVRPGAQRISVSGSTTPLTLLAFYHSAIGRLTLTGVNTAASPATLSGTLSSLPTVSSLEMYYTDSTTNLSDRGAVPVTSSSFVATVPANCVFTLVGSSAAPGAPVITQALLTADGFIMRGNNGVPFRNYRVVSTTNVALPQTQWMALATNAFGPGGYFDCTNAVAPTDGLRFLRVVMTNP